MNEQNIATLIKQRQEKFIETRTIIESEVNKFLSSLQMQDDNIKNQVGIKDGITCKDLLPELWSENFRPEVYAQQKASLDAYVSQVQAICDNLNAEAIACLTSG